MATKITKDDVPLLLKAIENLTRLQVLVGIPGDTPPRRMPAGQTHPPITNATIGYINEFGSPAANIPARPFLLPGIAAAMPAIITRLRTGARKALSFPLDPQAGVAVLTGVGLIAQNSVRAVITAGIPPPLAASTLRARKTRKVAPRKGETPLLDTSQLRMAVTYVLMPK